MNVVCNVKLRSDTQNCDILICCCWPFTESILANSLPICQNTFFLHFVKQRFEPFQFFVTSVWIEKFTKASEKWLHMGEVLGGPFCMLLAQFLDYFGDFFKKIWRQKVVFKGLFSAFSICQNTFPLQKAENSTGRCFDKS